MSCNVAFIGLGVMGYPMAGYISKAGHNVTVYIEQLLKLINGLQNTRVQKQIHPQKQLKGQILFLLVSVMMRMSKKFSTAQLAPFMPSTKERSLLTTPPHQSPSQKK